MEEQDSLEAIKSLHHDLLALAEARLPIIDKLFHDLNAHIESFQKLLDKKPKTEASRNTLAAGEFEADDGVKYSVNAEFKEEVTQLADNLSLDHVECAQLLIHGGKDAEELDRSPQICAVIRYHEYRSFLVECLRLLLKISLDEDIEEVVRNAIRSVIDSVVQKTEQNRAGGSLYTRKCAAAMLRIEQALGSLVEQAQRNVTLGHATTADAEEMMGLQHQNLTQQHESLGTVLSYLVKAKYSSADDFSNLWELMRHVDKWNSLVVHYVPALISFSAEVGSTEGNANQSEARAMNAMILESRESKPWPLRNLQAAATTWWLAEYHSWYFDQPAEALTEGTPTEKEVQRQIDTLMQALRDGAFQCTLSICAQMRSSDWYDPSRIGLIRSLLNDAIAIPYDAASVSPYFHELVMEQFEVFTYSFIANMPDMLRKFKADAEEQRRRMLSGFQSNVDPDSAQQERHLERFFVIMSYVYEGRPDAASMFWADTESNTYGFLQWFSRRVSTPLVGAFCEMFRAISEGEECATAAHKFLMDDGPTSSSRIRKASSLTWSQIFEELDFYAMKVRENPVSGLTATSTFAGKPKSVEIDEPETPIMLECYLRLTSHLCANSALVRAWILSHPTFHIVDTTFLLCHHSMPSHIRTCAYACLEALLTEKTLPAGDAVWTALDQWLTGGFCSGVSRPSRNTNPITWAEEMTFETISTDFDEAIAFVSLLQSLMVPSPDLLDLNDTLPFPEELGSSYRMPGLEPYIDLVMGKVFAMKSPQLEGSPKSRILASVVLQFVQTCLESFNENVLVLANRPGNSIENSLTTSSLTSYVRLHPFCRVMEWLFNDRVIEALFGTAHQNINEVNNADPDSPLITALVQSIRVLDLAMKLQSTYLDIVRPLVKDQWNGRRQPVINPSLTCIEDSVSTHLHLIPDLGFYCGSGNQDLTTASMELLKKLATSRRLNIALPSKLSSRIGVNKLIGALQHNHDVEPIARSLAQALTFNHQELDLGPDSAGFRVKYSILDFVEHTLAANSGKPTIAHALLGFECTGTAVAVSGNGLFARKASFFHAILKLSLDYLDGTDGSILYWTQSLKRKAGQIVENLRKSPLTSSCILADLRDSDVFFYQWLSQVLVDQTTLWEGCLVRDSTFLFTDAARTMEQFFLQRKFLFSFAGTELRAVTAEDTELGKMRMVSTLLGTTTTEEGDHPNLTVFDLLDFLELDTPDINMDPDLQLFAGFDLSICNQAHSNEPPRFNMELLEQLLALKRNKLRKELRKNVPAEDAAVEERLTVETQDILSVANGLNNAQALETARITALETWTNLVILIAQSSVLGTSSRSTYILQALQIISPKLEMFAYSTRPEALIFAHLTQVLLTHLDLKSAGLDGERIADMTNDRLFQLFKTALRAISNPDAPLALREIFYKICYQYLTNISDDTSASTQRQHSMTSVRTAGDGLIDTITDDAYSAEGTARISALMFLNALTMLGLCEKNQHFIEALARTNFVVALVEGIKDMPTELRQTGSAGVPVLMAHYKSKLSLLLNVSRSKAGAQNVLNAGLFHAVRVSGLFAADPDVGLEIDNPQALHRFYELLLAVLRVVCAVLITRGPQNRQTVEQGREFLAANRALLVGLLKRRGRVGAYERRDGEGQGEEAMEEVLEELVEGYVLLISLTGFLEFEDTKQNTRSTRRAVFT